jgi:hypothetical protein
LAAAGFAAMLTAFVLTMSGCAGVDSRVKDGRVVDSMDQSPDGSDFVEAIGIGAADPTVKTDTQRRALSRDAAIVKAQYELLSMIKGVTLEGGVTVQQAMEKDSELAARLSHTIRGAEVVKSEFTTDAGCVVTLRLPKDRLEELMGIKFN